MGHTAEAKEKADAALEPLPPATAQRTGKPSGMRRAPKLLVAALLALSAFIYLGGTLEIIPWRPSADRPPGGRKEAERPELTLREVYVQSSPQPPAALVSLSAQGTHAGRLALRAWFDDQAQVARSRGYAFPFRLARYQPGFSADLTANEATSYPITFSEEYKAQRPMAVAREEMHINAGAGVRATGTAKLLERMRAEYLRSKHARAHSYWSATPQRSMAGVRGTSDGDEPPEPEPPARWNYYVEDGLRVPNITHKPTLASLARMVANAYQPTTSDTWEPLGDPWDTHDSFGWTADGLRGHVFADERNRTVVISLKGTSSTFFLGGGSETSARDKYNDNRLFSCCCAYVDFSWSTVCNCHVSGNKCDTTCLQEAMADETADNYFYAAAQIFMDVVQRYPDANVVLAGHSLGGALATLLGLTFGLPAVGFEAPGDRLASERLHLPQPPGSVQRRLPLFHVGNTADPVFMGMCAGRTSSCYYAGYAMESRCHNGRQLVFDTVERRDWRLDIRHHRINEVIYLVIEPWGIGDPEERFPELRFENAKCKDCGLWNFINETSPQGQQQRPLMSLI
ncbi:putative lipase atg15 [Coemansia sp. RSA 2607]|nr:putative lipase atg15 [Coemansia sp. RSA 2607]